VLVEVCREITFEMLVREDNPNFDAELCHRMLESDVIFCCTPSAVPLFLNSYLMPTDGGAAKRRFISLIGAYKPHMQEIEAATLLPENQILVDSKEACLQEAGELIKTWVRKEHLLGIGELRSRVPSDGDGRENTVFKCVGMGIMDIVIGREILKIVAERGAGIQIERF